MLLSGISIFFFATMMFINIDAIPSASLYQTNDGQENNGLEEAGIQEILQRVNELTPWLNKRSSPLCDYRLQSRPLPLASALCGYGHNNKGGGTAQMNPFKYG